MIFNAFGSCLAAAWQLPGVCLAAAWLLPGSCLATAWLLPGSCLAAAYQLKEIIFSMDIGSNLSLFGINFWYFWRLLEAILGLLAPDAPQGTSRILPGACRRASGALQKRLWGQLELSLSQLGANLGPTWAQLEPTWSQLGPNLDPT